MLKIPLLDQTCSSSPIRFRCGSADKVVFPKHKNEWKTHIREKRTSSRETKEESCFTSLRILIRTGMQRKKSIFRHLVIHDSEYAFLHFSSVLSAEDNHFMGCKVDVNRSITVDSLLKSISTKYLKKLPPQSHLRRILRHCRWSNLVLQSFGAPLSKGGSASCAWTWHGKVFDKIKMRPGNSKTVPRANHSDFQTTLRIPACISVNDVNSLSSVQRFLGNSEVFIEAFGSHLEVHRPPPYIITVTRSIGKSK